MGSAVSKVRVLISGYVQDVGFRNYVKRRADALGLAGWVRNLGDGRVEAVFEGHESQVRKMIELCRRGAPLSRVSGVEVFEEQTEGLSSFKILS